MAGVKGLQRSHQAQCTLICFQPSQACKAGVQGCRAPCAACLLMAAGGVVKGRSAKRAAQSVRVTHSRDDQMLTSTVPSTGGRVQQ